MEGCYHCFGFMTLGAVEKCRVIRGGGRDFFVLISTFFSYFIISK